MIDCLLVYKSKATKWIKLDRPRPFHIEFMELPNVYNPILGEIFKQDIKVEFRLETQLGSLEYTSDDFVIYREGI